jgi:RNA-directed DNA polymerase
MLMLNGFRPGRGCHDAIESLFNTLRGKSKRVWILDADLAAAFDNIDHEPCSRRSATFPHEDGRRLAESGDLRGGERVLAHRGGDPAGAVISPLLLNIALHGLEEAAGVRYRTGNRAAEVADASPTLTRYADLCRARHKSAKRTTTIISPCA